MNFHIDPNTCCGINPKNGFGNRLGNGSVNPCKNHCIASDPWSVERICGSRFRESALDESCFVLRD